MAIEQPPPNNSQSSEQGNMRRERCCGLTGAWPSSAAPLLIKTSIACFLVLLFTAVARPSGSVTTGYGRTVVVEQQQCDHYAEQEVVAGLEFCPQLEPLRPILLENKRRLLRLALDAVDDAGGDSPLLLVNSLIEEAADIFFSKNRSSFGVTKGWVRKERFIDFVDTFYEQNLGRSRPVVIYVAGGDACALWDELKPQEVEESADDEPVLENLDFRRSAASAAAEGKTPLAMVTFGWDPTGSPFASPHFRECSTKVLELPQVVRWFVSHHSGSSPDPKVEYVPIGFGGANPRSGLQQSEIITPSKDKLNKMETCQVDDGMEVLFQCNNGATNTNRGPINEALQRGTQAESNSTESSVVPHVIPENHYPLDALDTVEASTNGLFAVSPPGTRPDCFRHYEFLLAGNIVYVPDDPSLHIVLAGLPVIFVQGQEDGWGKINCDTMVQHALEVAHRLDQGLKPGGGPPFDYGKLMLPHWVRFVRDRVWQAAAEVRHANNEAWLAGYEGEESENSRLYPEMVVGG